MFSVKTRNIVATVVALAGAMGVVFIGTDSRAVAPGPIGVPFDGCGTLVEGVECVLFQADSGGLYILSNHGGAGVGARLHVRGTIDPFCISYCQQGNGCIYATLVEPCNSFDGCGVLVQGVECVLFQADAGGLYVLSNLGAFHVGDRVRVAGNVNPSCITICQQGNGCIENNTIAACVDFDQCGKLVQGVECVLFRTNNGNLYVLDNYGNFRVGAKVRVTGELDPNCITICQQGNGCVHDNTIARCR